MVEKVFLRYFTEASISSAPRIIFFQQIAQILHKLLQDLGVNVIMENGPAPSSENLRIVRKRRRKITEKEVSLEVSKLTSPKLDDVLKQSMISDKKNELERSECRREGAVEEEKIGFVTDDGAGKKSEENKEKCVDEVSDAIDSLGQSLLSFEQIESFKNEEEISISQEENFRYSPHITIAKVS